MAASASTSPLENNGEIGGNTDDLSDPFHRAALERDMFDARLSQPINDLNSFSVLGMPAATIGSPSSLISCYKGNWSIN